jgi:hypothetical protein
LGLVAVVLIIVRKPYTGQRTINWWTHVSIPLMRCKGTALPCP